MTDYALYFVLTIGLPLANAWWYFSKTDALLLEQVGGMAMVVQVAMLAFVALSFALGGGALLLRDGWVIATFSPVMAVANLLLLSGHIVYLATHRLNADRAADEVVTE